MELKKYPLKKFTFHMNDGTFDYQLVINIQEEYMKLFKSSGQNKWTEIVSEMLTRERSLYDKLKAGANAGVQTALDVAMNAVALEQLTKSLKDEHGEDQ